MSALPTADPYLPGHGDPSWSASHYDLDLSYVLDGNRLSGTAVIRGTARQETSRVVLDLAHLQVQKVAVDGRPPAKWAHRDHRLVLTLRRPLQEGQGFTVQVRYSGRPKPLVVRPHGDAGWEELTDGVIVAGQPHGAPTWFPCNDRPDDKASYVVSVAVPTGYTVVANGTLTARERRGSGETWVYEQHEPMATYLATVQVGRYDLVRLEAGPAGVPITLAVPPGADWEPAFGRQAEMMAAYVDLFGPYPFPAYTAVVTDDDLDIPLESQSLSTFGRNHLDPDWRTNRLVAHELAHQWFGNTVTLRAWKDIWLHEGFACYAEWLWSESAGLGTADEHARHHLERLRELEEDVVVADPGPDLMFDDRVYKRGALTLHALRLRVGDAVFFPLLREWVARHRAGSVSTAEFEELAAELSGTDLGGLFDAWLRRKELPEAPWQV